MGDQNKNAPDPNQGLGMPDYGGGGMVPSSQVPVSMAQGQCIPGLQNIAPGPPPHHPANIQTSQIQQIHPGQHHPGQPSMAGQQILQQPIGQPQFIIQQPFGGQQYATFPQIAYANQQGQLVLQPAQFTIPGGSGQPQGQQVILTGVPQKPGQPQMITSSGGPIQGKPGQPSYTISSNGQLQMPGPPGPAPQQTFMLANPMPPGLQASMAGQTIPGQTMHTSMAGMKGGDNKPIMSGAPQLPGQPNPQQPQFVMSSHGMTYMQGGHPQLIQQNGQLIFRSPGPPEQQVMFSPSGQPHPQPPPTVQHPGSLTNPTNPMGGMQLAGPGPRPPLPVVGPPPGKTAISRAIAPLPSNVSQTNARMGYVGSNNIPAQPSPKSKQKMSPRGNHNGVGRPPVPKGASGMKMMPRMAGGAVNLPHPGPPGSPHMQAGSPRPPISSIPVHPAISAISSAIGPPTLSPMMGGEGVPPTLPTMSVSASIPLSQMSRLVTSTPVTSNPVPKPTDSSLDPPTLTKEIMTPMPSLGQPNLQKSLSSGLTVSKPLTTTTTFSTMTVSGDSEPGLMPTPKAVVKPQVLTHVIDGHVIKESSQPFPVSPVKATARRKSEKGEEKTQGVKRGPGRPPGSAKTITDTIKANGNLEPPEKKLKAKETIQTNPVQFPAPAPLPPPTQQPALTSVRGNPLKWNVTEVCDFIKNLPGCAEYVDDFAQQEIDGQALMLLKADHLMTAMSIKLGPALKICSHITQIREELNKN